MRSIVKTSLLLFLGLLLVLALMVIESPQDASAIPQARAPIADQYAVDMRPVSPATRGEIEPAATAPESAPSRTAILPRLETPEGAKGYGSIVGWVPMDTLDKAPHPVRAQFLEGASLSVREAEPDRNGRFCLRRRLPGQHLVTYYWLEDVPGNRTLYLAQRIAEVTAGAETDIGLLKPQCEDRGKLGLFVLDVSRNEVGAIALRDPSALLPVTLFSRGKALEVLLPSTEALTVVGLCPEYEHRMLWNAALNRWHSYLAPGWRVFTSFAQAEPPLGSENSWIAATVYQPAQAPVTVTVELGEVNARAVTGWLYGPDGDRDARIYFTSADVANGANAVTLNFQAETLTYNGTYTCLVRVTEGDSAYAMHTSVGVLGSVTLRLEYVPVTTGKVSMDIPPNTLLRLAPQKLGLRDLWPLQVTVQADHSIALPSIPPGMELLAQSPLSNHYVRGVLVGGQQRELLLIEED